MAINPTTVQLPRAFITFRGNALNNKMLLTVFWKAQKYNFQTLVAKIITAGLMGNKEYCFSLTHQTLYFLGA